MRGSAMHRSESRGACVAMCERVGTYEERMEHPVVSVCARERLDAGGSCVCAGE